MDPAQEPLAVQKAEELIKKANVHIQRFLDKAAPHRAYRWLGLACLFALYVLRVYLLDGFFIVSYALAIYNLNLVLGFITPSVDPELEGPVLPSKNDDEYRPFVRRLPEMKFWVMSCRSFLLGMFATLFPFIDVPVFWPILFLYWLALATYTLRRQIKHMIKHRYLPFDFGKPAVRSKGLMNENVFG